MINIENVEVVGWEHAIRGMRNPMNSWDKSDSYGCYQFNGDVDKWVTCNNCLCNDKCDKRMGEFKIGNNDTNLMNQLSNTGTDHSKYMRMIIVYADIVSPMYWWKEFDTYKVGTVRNSCSTMHKIQEKEFTLEDFSCEHLLQVALDDLERTIETLDDYRVMYLETKDKKYWWQMIQLLPSSYNQRSTVMLNYQVLKNMYHSRKSHKLDEWVDFCKWIETLPYSELITGKE